MSAAPHRSGSRLRLAGGFRADELPTIEARFRPLERRLNSFEPRAIELELSVKDRDQPSQQVTVACWIPGWPRTVATSNRPDLEAAVNEVRDDLVRRLTDLKSRTEPRNNRQRRA